LKDFHKFYEGNKQTVQGMKLQDYSPALLGDASTQLKPWKDEIKTENLPIFCVNAKRFPIKIKGENVVVELALHIRNKVVYCIH